MTDQHYQSYDAASDNYRKATTNYCQTCGGDGHDPMYPYDPNAKCDDCKGTGRVQAEGEKLGRHTSYCWGNDKVVCATPWICGRDADTEPTPPTPSSAGEQLSVEIPRWLVLQSEIDYLYFELNQAVARQKPATGLARLIDKATGYDGIPTEIRELVEQIKSRQIEYDKEIGE